MSRPAPRTAGAFQRTLDPRFATGRLVWFGLVGVLVTLLTSARFTWRVRAVAGWDAAVALILVTDWWHIWRADAFSTARHAESEDIGRILVWLVALGAGLFSLFSALVVLRRSHEFASGAAEMWSALALLAVVLSWLLTHTAYALRYAHMHYAASEPDGFDFPGEQPPAEIDFAYFAFTIGISFAVSDVNVTRARTRRTVFCHALVAFIYNLTILALAIQLCFAWLG